MTKKTRYEWWPWFCLAMSHHAIIRHGHSSNNIGEGSLRSVHLSCYLFVKIIPCKTSVIASPHVDTFSQPKQTATCYRQEYWWMAVDSGVLYWHILACQGVLLAQQRRTVARENYPRIQTVKKTSVLSERLRVTREQLSDQQYLFFRIINCRLPTMRPADRMSPILIELLRQFTVSWIACQGKCPVRDVQLWELLIHTRFSQDLEV